MKKHYPAKLLRTFFLIAGAITISQLKSQIVLTYTYTGAMQTFVVPPCISNMTIEAWGAQGGVGTPTTVNYGGYAKAVFNVVAGNTLNILAGSQPSSTAGGYNGGGAGDNLGFGGGGASDVRLNGTALADRVIVAGGAGGGGIWSSNGEAIIGGAGGGLVGGDGYRTNISSPGGAGGGQTQLTNGFCGSANNAASSGSLGIGGSIAVGACGCTSGYGGGGGYYGGGAGGNCRGGGGGSGYISPSATGTMFTSGINVGHGKVVISYFTNGAGVSASVSTPSICTGSTVSLNASGVLSYTWLPVGPFAGSNTGTIIETPTITTTYTVQGTNNLNCISSSVLTVTVSPGQPTLSITASTTQLCMGKTATLTANGALTYSWTNGINNGVSFIPSTTNTYVVTGQNACGTTTASATISVTPLPVTLAGNLSTVCAGNPVTLSVTAVANSYTLQPLNQVTTNSTMVVSPQATTIYTVAASDGTCSGLANFTITANPVPTITSSSSSTLICPGESSTLTATGGINYTWSPVGTVASSIVVTPTSSILYSAVGANTFGCLGNTSQGIVVGAQPTLAVNTNSVAICAGAIANLTVTGANTYQWNGGPTTSTYAVSPLQNTVYSVTGTLTSSGCAATETIAINVFAPTLSITGTSSVCEGLGVALTASAPGASNYTWNPGGGLFASITVTPSSNTTYTASSVSNSLGLNCPVNGTLLVTVAPNPTVVASATPSVLCRNETATLSAQGASTYVWSNSSSTLSAAATMTATSSNITTLSYTVSGIAANGCENSYPVSITVNACNGIEEALQDMSQVLIYPNPSTGEFMIKSDSDISLRIINELGQLVKTIGLSKQNNRSVSVGDLSNGIYFVIGQNSFGEVNRKIVIAR